VAVREEESMKYCSQKTG